MTTSTRELILDDIKKVWGRLEMIRRMMTDENLKRGITNIELILASDVDVLMEEIRNELIETGYMTMDGAWEALERNKDATGYFSGQVKATDMAMMLREMGFGVAEANTIIAALVLVGAKFQVG